MRWVLGAVGAVVVVVAAVVVVGMLLPRSHVASVSASYRASPDALWTTLTDIPALPTWRPDLTRVEPLPDREGRRRWRETTKSGTVTYEVMEAEPPQRLVARIADEGLPYGGTWTYEILPAEGGSRLTITERGEIYNPLFRFMARYVFGYTSGMEAVLRALGRKHGEEVEPELPRGA
jgi:uncharacterized protein YndB with AHSA1/START domain